jgi:hypothetical protein
MTTDHILGAGVYRLMAEEYRAGIADRHALAAEGHPDPATHATDTAVLAAHLAVAEAVLNTAPSAPARRRWRWWPW